MTLKMKGVKFSPLEARVASEVLQRRLDTYMFGHPIIPNKQKRDAIRRVLKKLDGYFT